MIGKVIEGRFTGEGIYKLPEKNAFYIETVEGKKIGLSKKNAISIVDISEKYSVKGCRILCVTWNNYETSIVQLGFPPSEAPVADPVPMEETVSAAESVRPAESVNDGIRKGKALVCDMCGGNDLRIQDGMAVCQHCDTRYSIEDVQKIVYGKGHASRGATRPEDMSRLEKLFVLARRAKKDNNTENAAKYYDLIQQEDPSSWEAAFYSTFYAALNTNIAGIQSAALKISNSFRSILDLIQEAELDWKERYLAIYEMVHMTAGAASVLASGARKHYNEVGSGPAGRYRDEAMARVYSAAMMLVELGDQIEKVYTGDQEFCQLACLSWRTSIDFLLEDENKKLFYVIHDQEKLKRIILDISRKVECYDKEYISFENNVPNRCSAQPTSTQSNPAAGDPPIKYTTGGMMAWSIVTLLLCPIPGVVALVKTSGINNCATRTEQEKKLSSAKTWNIVGTVLGGLNLILAIIGISVMSVLSA